MGYGHDRHSEFAVERRKQRELAAYKREVDTLIKQIEDGGFNAALKYVDCIIDKTKFLLVHATNFFPQHNMIKTSHIASLFGHQTIKQTRETLHFTLNNMVTSHSSGNWDNCKYAVLFPYDHVAKRVHLSPFFDTTIVGNVKLPVQTTIIVKKLRVLPKDYPKIINCWGHKIKVTQHVKHMGMLARALCLYDEHYAHEFRVYDKRLRHFCQNNTVTYAPEDYVQGVLNISVSLQKDIRSFYWLKAKKQLSYDALKEFADMFSVLTFDNIRRDYSGEWTKPAIKTDHHVVYTTKPMLEAVREELLHRNIPLIIHESNSSTFEKDQDNIERFKTSLSYRKHVLNPYMKLVYDRAEDVLCLDLNPEKMEKIFLAYIDSLNKFHSSKMHFNSWYNQTDNHLLNEVILQDILKTEYIENIWGHKYWIKHPEEVKAITRWLRHKRMQHRLKLMVHAIDKRGIDERLVDILLHIRDNSDAEDKIISLGLSDDDAVSLLNQFTDVQKEISKIVLDYEKVHGQQVLEKLDKEKEWLAREYDEVHKNHKVYGRGVRRVWRLHNQVMKQFSEDMDPSIKNQYAIAHKQLLLDLDSGDTNKIEKSINVQLSIIKLLQEWIKEHVVLSKELKEYS